VPPRDSADDDLIVPGFIRLVPVSGGIAASELKKRNRRSVPSRAVAASRARALPAESRPAYLAAGCRDNPALRLEIEVSIAQYTGAA